MKLQDPLLRQQLVKMAPEKECKRMKRMLGNSKASKGFFFEGSLTVCQQRKSVTAA